MRNHQILYFIKRYKFHLFILALVLGLVGSYQLYASEYTQPLKALSVIVYSTFMLFSFSPTNGVLNEAPLAYEIAMWLAPMFTMVGFFSVFQRVFNTIRQALFHMGKKHLLLLGQGDDVHTFMKNMPSNAKHAYMLLCDMGEVVDEDSYADFPVKIVRLDFQNPKNPMNLQKIKDESIGDFGKLISFLPEPVNYGRIQALHSMFEETDQTLDVYLQTTSTRMKEIIELKMDALMQFDIHYFNTYDLAVLQFFFQEDFPFRMPDGFENDWKEKTFHSMEEVADAMGVYHLVIIGFTAFAERFLEQATTLLTSHALNNLKVTVLDPRGEDAVAAFKFHRPMLDHAMDLQVNTLDLANIHADVERAMTRETISGILLFDADVRTNVFLADQLIDAHQDTPFLIYSDDEQDVAPIIDSFQLRHPNIESIGDLRHVLNEPTIIEETLNSKAKAFNAYYNRVTNTMMGWDKDTRSAQEQWMVLSNVKKESSLSQSMHRRTKVQLLQKMSESSPIGDDPHSLVDHWRTALETQSVEEQVDLIEKDPLMNYLTALEHKRWNNFYYLRGFRFAEEKDEARKTHDCLIDDWNQFMSGKQRDKAIYDFMSVLSVYEENDA